MGKVGRGLASGRMEIPLDRFKYEQYRTTPEWAALRVQALLLAGYRCRLCNRDHGSLHVHHRTYERIGHEDIEDLTVLCPACHDAYHKVRGGVGKGSAGKPKRKQPPRPKTPEQVAEKVRRKVAFKEKKDAAQRHAQRREEQSRPDPPCIACSSSSPDRSPPVFLRRASEDTGLRF